MKVDVTIELMCKTELGIFKEKVAKSMLDNKEKAELFDRIQAREKIINPSAICENSELALFDYEDII